MYVERYNREIDIDKPMFDQFPELSGLERFDGSAVSLSHKVGGIKKGFEIGSFKVSGEDRDKYCFGLWEIVDSGNRIPAGFFDLNKISDKVAEASLAELTKVGFPRGFEDLHSVTDDRTMFDAFVIREDLRGKGLGHVFLTFCLVTLEKEGFEGVSLVGDSTLKRVQNNGDKTEVINTVAHNTSLESGDTLVRLPDFYSSYTKYSALDPKLNGNEAEYQGESRVPTHISSMQASLLMEALGGN